MSVYIVVFEGVGGCHGHYKGIRTIQDFDSKEAFQSYLATTTSQDKVVAEGVTKEEAERIALEVEIKPYFDVAYYEACQSSGFNWPMYFHGIHRIEHLMSIKQTPMIATETIDHELPPKEADALSEEPEIKALFDLAFEHADTPFGFDWATFSQNLLFIQTLLTYRGIKQIFGTD